MSEKESESWRGRCLCGAVAWHFDGAPMWQSYCHCESCRRACSAPVAAFLAAPRAAFRWTAEEPARFQSSPGVKRSFCPRCGSQIAYECDAKPAELHLYAASLEDPARFRPQWHDCWGERLPWFALRDALPR